MAGLDNRGIDEILLEIGVININDFKKAVEYKRRTNKRIEEVLIELGLVTQKDIMDATAAKYGLSYIDLDDYPNLDQSLISKISKNLITRYNVMPLEMVNGELYVAMSDPADIYAIDDLRLATGFEIKPVLADEFKIKEKIDVYCFGKAPSTANRPVAQRAPQKQEQENQGPSGKIPPNQGQPNQGQPNQSQQGQSRPNQQQAIGQQARDPQPMGQQARAPQPRSQQPMGQQPMGQQPMGQQPRAPQPRSQQPMGQNPNNQQLNNQVPMGNQPRVQNDKQVPLGQNPMNRQQAPQTQGGQGQSGIQQTQNGQGQIPGSQQGRQIQQSNPNNVNNPNLNQQQVQQQNPKQQIQPQIQNNNIVQQPPLNKQQNLTPNTATGNKDEFDDLFNGFDMGNDETFEVNKGHEDDDFDIFKNFESDINNGDLNESQKSGNDDNDEMGDFYNKFSADLGKSDEVSSLEEFTGNRDSNFVDEFEDDHFARKENVLGEFPNFDEIIEEDENTEFLADGGIHNSNDDELSFDFGQKQIPEVNKDINLLDQVYNEPNSFQNFEASNKMEGQLFSVEDELFNVENELKQNIDNNSKSEDNRMQNTSVNRPISNFEKSLEENEYMYNENENYAEKHNVDMFKKNSQGFGEPSGLDALFNYDVDLDQKPLFKEKLGNYLVKNNVISETQLLDALDIQKKSGDLLGKVLVKKGFIKRRTLYEFLEKQLGVKYVDLDSVEVQNDALSIVPEVIARRHTIVPFSREGMVLKVAMSDPLNIFSIDDLRIATGLEIQPYLADDEQVRDFIDVHYEKIKGSQDVINKRKEIENLDEEFKKVNEEVAFEVNEADTFEDVDDNVEDAPIVKMVNIIFQGAVARKASDIHMEPQEEGLLVRYRVDGELIEIMRQDRKAVNALVARIKIISGLNIAEKRIPQDGRITVNINKKPYDMRVSVLPTMFGEKIVIRIADKEGFNVNKSHLGFFEDDLEKFDSILANPHGVVLVTGPTGSGKSTTLYTALKELAKPNVNIVTVEDPVEATVKGVNQVQVNNKAGLNFAIALRSFLRQDPDIIMVGEIRDGETAEIAVRAAITGHLVLSTLHTNDAPSTITRIIDMGIEPYLISSAIVGVIAQRLVRRLCKKCKREHVLDNSERQILELRDGDNPIIYEPVGCDECNNIGYKGRIAVHEILTFNRELRDLVTQNVTSDVLRDAAVKCGMRTLKYNCMRLIFNGVTTIEEMFNISHEEV